MDKKIRNEIRDTIIDLQDMETELNKLWQALIPYIKYEEEGEKNNEDKDKENSL